MSAPSRVAPDASVTTLTPRALESLLAPLWCVDRPVLGEWVLVDVYPILRRARLACELERGRARIVLEVHADDGVLGVNARALAPSVPASEIAATKDALVAQLRRRSLSSRRFHIDDRPTSPRIAAADHDVVCVPTPLDGDPDAFFLRADGERYARLFGVRPRAVSVCVDDLPSGLSLHYPAPTTRLTPPSGHLRPLPAHFQRRRFRRYLARLGFAIEGDLARIVPTPTTFARAVRDVLGAPPPLMPRFVDSRRLVTGPRTWIAHVVTHGELPVAVASRLHVEARRLLPARGHLSRVGVDVGLLAHDMSLHALGLHAIAADDWAELTAAARRQLARGGWERRRHLARFVEETLTRAAWDTWNVVDTPEDFPSAFAPRVRELLDELRSY